MGFGPTARREVAESESQPAEAKVSRALPNSREMSPYEVSVFTPNTPTAPFVGLKALVLAFAVGGSNPSPPNEPNTAAHDVSSFSPVLTANLKAIANGSFLQKAISEDNLSLAEAATWRSSGEYL